MLPARMAAKVRLGAGGCWEWTGVRQTDGYAKVKWRKRMVSAHRVTYELLVGSIPEGLEIDHLCSVRHCVNPAHMEPVTHRENVRRTNLRRFGASSLPGACVHGHVLSKVGVRRSGQCAECDREAGRRYRARLAAA